MLEEFDVSKPAFKDLDFSVAVSPGHRLDCNWEYLKDNRCDIVCNNDACKYDYSRSALILINLISQRTCFAVVTFL